MRIAALAALILLVAGGATAALLPRPVALYEGAPARPHAALGPVSVIALERAPGTGWTATQAEALAAEARAAYGRSATALAHVSHEILPGGAVLSRATAVSWQP